jgi:hypothetical protein
MESSLPQLFGLLRGPRALLLCSLVLLCAAAFSGCNRGPAMSEVRGTVFYKDGTVPKAGVTRLNFEPTAGSTAEVRKGATGTIRSDGSFEMWTRMPGDGVYHGEYAVTFGVLKAVMDATPLIQEKYMRADTTPYTVTVDDDIDDLKFEIEPLPGVKGAPPTASAAN